MAMLNDVRKLPQMDDRVTKVELDDEFGIATIHFNNGVEIRAHTFHPAEATEPWPDLKVPKIPSDDEILKQTEPLVSAVVERVAILIRQGKVKGYKYVGQQPPPSPPESADEYTDTFRGRTLTPHQVVEAIAAAPMIIGEALSEYHKDVIRACAKGEGRSSDAG